MKRNYKILWLIFVLNEIVASEFLSEPDDEPSAEGFYGYNNNLDMEEFSPNHSQFLTNLVFFMNNLI